MDTLDHDVIVVGAGIAGLSAALMLGRALRDTVVLDTGTPRNRYAHQMHGVLGHDGTNPYDLLSRGRAEVSAYGVPVLDTSAVSVADTGPSIAVTTGDGTTITARRLLLATGVRDALPDIPGLAEGWGRDVLHCPYCHGWEVRGRRLAVLATSPMALHQAQLIRQWSPEVTFFAAGAGPISAADEATLAARGVVVDLRPIRAVVRDATGTMTALQVDGGDQIGVDAVFTAGQLQPIDGTVADLGLDRTEQPFGAFITVDPTGRTSHPRIWAAGNVVNPMANVPISAAAGTMAGSMINADLVTEDFDRAVAEVAR
ncbi:MAG: NAD(P)/FAD-dependent oxidoreductase [Propionibacteriales bacterium]|nr:NAD(P)/FAD-dependent oxidoreductase [Propionibacteriales bacterium]